MRDPTFRNRWGLVGVSGIDFKAYQNERVALVDAALQKSLPGEEVLPARLHQAMRYSVFAGGKRLRPVLVIAAAEAVGGCAEQVLHAACALEMIHTYSLIHDDLPAMDDDNFRRGRPTCHREFDEATAILAGDALLTEAFLLLADPVKNKAVAPEQALQVMEIVARAAGSRGMVGGQAVDMDSEGKEIDFPTLEYIHTHKTGVLILASVKAGAILAGADEAQMAALTRYAESAGLAFQIADDILDIVGDQERIGKDVGSDEARGKATYPALLGLADSRQRAEELYERAIAALEPLGPLAEPLRQLAWQMVNRNS